MTRKSDRKRFRRAGGGRGRFGTGGGAGTAPRDECYVYNDVGHSVLLVDGGGEPVQANLYGAFGEVLRAWGDSRNDRLGNTNLRGDYTSNKGWTNCCETSRKRVVPCFS